MRIDTGRITAGIVLAAGCGVRLAEAECPAVSKLLIPVRGKPLVWHALRGLELAGCQRILVILGHAAEAVRSAVLATHDGGSRVEFLVNPHYRMSNGLSVLRAKDHITENFLLVMGDHLVADEIMAALPRYPPPAGGATLLVDRRVDAVFDLDDATKVQAVGGRIFRIGKRIADFNCVDIGVFYTTPALFAALEAVLAEKGDVSLTDGIQRLADAGLMRAAPVNGRWQDIDTPEMLAHAERNFSEFRLAN